MSKVIVAIAISIAAVYATTGIGALTRVNEKVNTRAQQIENLEKQLYHTKR